MKVKISDIVTVLEEFAPLNLQESFDNSGLLVGDAGAAVESALLCVDINESVLDQAIENGDGMVISHHPVIFHPLKHLTGSTYIERVVTKAIRRNIVLYACHTNLDSAPGGMSYRLSNLLGLQNVILLGEASQADPSAGFGTIGYLGEEMDASAFLELVKQRIEIPALKFSAPLPSPIRKVALCTGAGRNMIEDAIRAGADVYLSSEFRYNDFLDAAGRIMLVEVGHFESEYCAIDLLFDIIRKKMPTFALRKSGKTENPVNYFI